MKIVTYNVNGLRPRVLQHGSLLKLLNSLDADIICFQETKLSRQDLSADLTMAEGYESFLSCTRTSDKGRTCYSGVATFCRVDSPFSSNEVALPLVAEEGITGLLGYSRKRDLKRGVFLEGLDDLTIDNLLKIDSEGRCIITDHGHFVLFNVYGPRAVDDDSERVHFKHLFYLVLQKRCEYLLSEGKRVFVVGDLNIAPTVLDCCDAKPGFEDNRFRRWLRSLLMDNGGGPFIDCFRAKNPDRKEAYTCWAQNTGAEEFNFGSRIDHIIIAGSCFHDHNDMKGHNILVCHVKECDMLMKFQRAKFDNKPKWLGGRSVKLEGSDHAPVYVLLRDVPNLPAHNTPSLAIRYIPEVRGRQQTIVSVLMKKQVSLGVKDCAESTSLNDDDIPEASSAKHAGSSQNSDSSEHGTGHREAHLDFGRNSSTNSEARISGDVERENFCGASDEIGSKKGKLSPICSAPVRKKMKQNSSSQLSIRSFFQKSNTPSSNVIGSVTSFSHTQFDTTYIYHDSSHLTEGTTSSIEASKNEDGQCSFQGKESCFNLHDQNQEDSSTNLSEKERENLAFLRWQTIQKKMQSSLPLCKGHGEPCVARSVKKTGPNIGRGFYVCARAKGPASNPEANCGYFQWALAKPKRK